MGKLKFLVIGVMFLTGWGWSYKIEIPSNEGEMKPFLDRMKRFEKKGKVDKILNEGKVFFRVYPGEKGEGYQEMIRITKKAYVERKKRDEELKASRGMIWAFNNAGNSIYGWIWELFGRKKVLENLEGTGGGELIITGEKGVELISNDGNPSSLMGVGL
jgi:hypothetical protein